MKALVNTYLNIRTEKPELHPANNPGFYKPGDEVDIVGTTLGDVYKENNIWCKLDNGAFVWSGGLNGEGIPIDDFILKHPLKIEFSNEKMGWAFQAPDGISVMEMWNDHQALGQNVRLAVLDSGINMNIPDLNAAIKDKLKDVKSFIAADSITDDHGHGTACASIAASRGGRIFGTAPMCDLIIGKIRNASETFTPEGVLAALKWACEERKADIVSMSFSSNNLDDTICNYIRTQTQPPNNRIFVGAVPDAGEFSKDKNVTPANCSGAISVGAYMQQRIACPASGWNPSLFFISPGAGLNGYTKEGGITSLNCETSYACPFTAGLIASLLSFYKKNNKTYTTSTIINLLTSPECVDMLDNHNPLQHGKGIINLNKVLTKIT